MRKLPVYILADTSGSMTGEPIAAVNEGIGRLVAALRQDPQALEMAWLSLIEFNTEARQVVPLTELVSFNPPPLTANGITSLGRALTVLAEAIGREVQQASDWQKGDWKPLVFILTDGVPTDDWDIALGALRAARPGLIVACAAGAHADTGVLKQITEAVVELDTADQASLSAFFQWVSASIAVTSQKIDLTKKDSGGLKDLPPPPDEIKVVL